MVAHRSWAFDKIENKSIVQISKSGRKQINNQGVYKGKKECYESKGEEWSVFIDGRNLIGSFLKLEKELVLGLSGLSYYIPLSFTYFYLTMETDQK